MRINTDIDRNIEPQKGQRERERKRERERERGRKKREREGGGGGNKRGGENIHSFIHLAKEINY